jgi:bifunctional UDP-N-acetylglucosamine pyrophosphorylase/glucosamine-1-phosphate N-acetyltransferase
MKDLAVVILAAGQGTRMRSRKQKILHEVGGRPMVAHVFEAAAAISQRPPVLVVGAQEDGIRRYFGHRAIYVEQPEQLGTGHATLMAAHALDGSSDQVLVAYADMPLLRSETMGRLAEKQAKTGAALVMLSVMGEPDSTFGRVVRDSEGRVTEIVEVAEARQRPDGEGLLALRELNVGVYCFAADWLWHNLPGLPLRQARSGSEYYLTDMVGLAVEQGERVEAILLEDADESLGAGTRAELAEVERALRRRVNAHWMAAGVTLIDPETTYIEETASIGQDTIIWPNTYVLGRSSVGEDCVLGPNTIVRDAEIGRGCRIEQAVVEMMQLEAGTVVGPFTHLRGQGLTGR